MRFKAIAACAFVTMTAPGIGLAQTAPTQKNVTAEDIATKPLADMNLKKDEIPPLLLAAQENPYDLSGLRRCSALQAEIGRLNSVLGDDIDIAQAKSRGQKRANAAGNLAQSVVGSLIPFGGIIREISGANENQRQWQNAIYAGSSRRAFLKGVGQTRGCPYPARAAGPQQIAAAEAAAAQESGGSAKNRRR